MKIQIATKDNLQFDGDFIGGSKDKPAVMYIHGMFGNYYTPEFVDLLRDKLSENNFAYLATNNRGFEENSKTELLEESHLDISAGIKFLLANGYKQIILIGHSAGTVKVVRYLFEGEYRSIIAKLVLISPIDPLGGRIAHGRTNIDEFLKKAQDKVYEGRGQDIITPDFDHDKISYQTFISWYKRDDYGRMFEFCDKNYDFPLLKKINVPVKIISGTKDEYLHPTSPNHAEEAINILINKIPNSDAKLITEAGHNFRGFEVKLVQAILEFISQENPSLSNQT